MAALRAMRRLLHIRQLEEEQCRAALESALAEQQRLQEALTVAMDRNRRGRLLVATSAYSAELTDRLAGLEESHAAQRLAEILSVRIEVAQQNVIGIRQSYLAKRVERRQAETLIEQHEKETAIVADRRSQQSQDDWHRSRIHRGSVPEPRLSTRRHPAPVTTGSAAPHRET
jgi:hypothetical protein